MKDIAVPIIIAMFSGGGLFSFLIFLFNKPLEQLEKRLDRNFTERDNKLDGRLDRIEEKLDKTINVANANQYRVCKNEARRLRNKLKNGEKITKQDIEYLRTLHEQLVDVGNGHKDVEEDIYELDREVIE